jgi:hypothetical protein
LPSSVKALSDDDKQFFASTVKTQEKVTQLAFSSLEAIRMAMLDKIALQIETILKINY